MSCDNDNDNDSDNDNDNVRADKFFDGCKSSKSLKRLVYLK